MTHPIWKHLYNFYCISFYHNINSLLWKHLFNNIWHSIIFVDYRIFGNEIRNNNQQRIPRPMIDLKLFQVKKPRNARLKSNTHPLITCLSIRYCRRHFQRSKEKKKLKFRVPDDSGLLVFRSYLLIFVMQRFGF